MTERRSQPRVEISHTVLYFSDHYPRPRVGSTLDLSHGGTRIETPYGLRKGERLEISIAIDPRVIKCRGKVVHLLWVSSNKLRVGIRFDDLSKQDRLYLKQYISCLSWNDGN
ncbi:MAG: hypothetical protein GTO12_10440 [Proteobacteria bacterium]|nr:hypothetical protein [Pseudomonadota bacterium]